MDSGQGQSQSDVKSSTVSEVMDRVDSPVLSFATQRAFIDPLSASVSLMKVVKQSEFGGKCSPTGGTFLRNGNLLLVDPATRRLIEFDDKWALVRAHKVAGTPINVSRAEGDHIFVSFYAEKELYLYEIKSALTLVNKIPLQRSIWGVAVSDSNIIIGGGHNETLTALSQQGDILRTLAPDCKLHYNASIASSEKMKTIYHPSEDKIICRDPQGETVFTYSHPQLSDPRGIGIDASSNVYVCGLKSGNVHQISADGQRGRILIEKFDSIQNPWGVVVHPTKNIIVVTTTRDDSNTTVFEVYRLD